MLSIESRFKVNLLLVPNRHLETPNFKVERLRHDDLNHAEPLPMSLPSVSKHLKVLETAKEVYENRSKRVPTAKLNEVMLPIIENYPPPAWKGKYIKIKYITQLPAGSVPSFVFFCNLPQWIKDPYKRFLENKIRENWDFTGTPINIFIREK